MTLMIWLGYAEALWDDTTAHDSWTGNDASLYLLIGANTMRRENSI
jgi:hypothetical protein